MKFLGQGFQKLEYDQNRQTENDTHTYTRTHTHRQTDRHDRTHYQSYSADINNQKIDLSRFSFAASFDKK